MTAKTKAPELSKADMLIIRQVYMANLRFGMTPFLPAPKWCYRAKALADRGLLKGRNNHPVPDFGKDTDWARYAFTVTTAGIEAYNAVRRRERRAKRRERA